MTEKVSGRVESLQDKRPWKSEEMKARWADPAYREERRQATAALWEDKQYRQKQADAREQEDYLTKMRAQGLHNPACRANLRPRRPNSETE